MRYGVWYFVEVLRFFDMLLKFIMVVDYWELFYENYMVVLMIWIIDFKFFLGVYYMLGGWDVNKILILFVVVGILELLFMKLVGDL